MHFLAKSMAVVAASAYLTDALAIPPTYSQVPGYKLTHSDRETLPSSKTLISTSSSKLPVYSPYNCGHTCDSTPGCKFFAFYTTESSDEPFCNYYNDPDPYAIPAYSFNETYYPVKTFSGYQKVSSAPTYGNPDEPGYGTSPSEPEPVPVPEDYQSPHHDAPQNYGRRSEGHVHKRYEKFEPTPEPYKNCSNSTDPTYSKRRWEYALPVPDSISTLVEDRCGVVCKIKLVIREIGLWN